MNTLPSSSLTIPPRPVRAPQKHRAGTRGPGGGPFQPLRCREVSPCSRAAGERGSVRHPTARRAGAGSGHWAPRGGGRGPGSKACEPSPGDGVSGRLPCPDEVEQEEGKRPGSPAPALPAESREMGTHPHLLRSCPRGAALQASQGGAVPAASRLCVARPWPCSLERSGAWAARGAFSPAVPMPSHRRLRGARSGRWRSCLVFRSSSQFPRLPALPLDRLQKADSPENGNEPPGHWVAPAGRPLGWAPHLSRRN